MLFMVKEKFKNQNAQAVYKRFKENGRMIPEGLTYVDSWVEENYDGCFQLMSCDDPSLFQYWIERWQDLVEFEIVPVMPSKTAWERFSATE